MGAKPNERSCLSRNDSFGVGSCRSRGIVPADLFRPAGSLSPGRHVPSTEFPVGGGCNGQCQIGSSTFPLFGPAVGIRPNLPSPLCCVFTTRRAPTCCMAVRSSQAALESRSDREYVGRRPPRRDRSSVRVGLGKTISPPFMVALMAAVSTHSVLTACSRSVLDGLPTAILARLVAKHRTHMLLGRTAALTMIRRSVLRRRGPGPDVARGISLQAVP
jgi:hypothetical protein